MASKVRSVSVLGSPSSTTSPCSLLSVPLPPPFMKPQSTRKAFPVLFPVACLGVIYIHICRNGNVKNIRSTTLCAPTTLAALLRSLQSLCKHRKALHDSCELSSGALDVGDRPSTTTVLQVLYTLPQRPQLPGAITAS